jgi:hypothetical protein
MNEDQDKDIRYLTRAEIVEMIHGVLALSDAVFEQDHIKDEFDILMIKASAKLDQCREKSKNER